MNLLDFGRLRLVDSLMTGNRRELVGQIMDAAEQHLKTLPPLKQSAWMPNGLRRWLIAVRPWSFPISIVPIAVTGAVLHKTQGVELLTLDYAATFILVLALHAAANLTNTYYDYRNKVNVHVVFMKTTHSLWLAGSV